MTDTKDFHKIRLPPWNPDKPRMWFVECENLLDLSGMPATDQKSRAILITRELPKEVKATVEQLITSPNASSRYDDMKNAVLGQHEESPEEAYNALEQMSLGGQKPFALGHAMISKTTSETSYKTGSPSRG